MNSVSVLPSVRVGSRRQAQKDQTRRRILQAAKHLCSRQGFAATRTSDIAHELGLSHGVLFVHFPSREALLVALVETETQAMLQAIHHQVEMGGSVRDVLQQHLAGLLEHEDLYVWILREATILPQGVSDTIASLHTTISWHLAQAAERERQQGTIRYLPDDFLFNCWIGLIHHYLANREKFVPNGHLIPSIGNELISNYWNMVKKKENI